MSGVYTVDRQLYTNIVNDWSTLPVFIDHFEREAEEAKKEIVMVGRIESLAKDIPSIMDKRFTQLQIINATLSFFETNLEKTKSKHYRKYLENYQRSLTSRDVEKYVNGEQEVVDIALIINEISLLRNVFISITKGIDAKSFQIHNITKLRVAGLDDATID